MRFRHLDPDENLLELGRWKRRKVRKMMSTEVDLIRLWRLDCEGRGISDLVIKYYGNYLREYRRDARPLLGWTTFDLSSFLLESDVLFPEGSAIVPAARARLSELAGTLKQSIGPVMVSGHTDSLGDDEVNQRLGSARAEAVVSLFR